MTDGHALLVLDEPLLIGRSENRDAWHGYFSSFSDYVIYSRRITADGASVAVLGSTMGSHLGSPDEEEMKLDVVWRAEVVDKRLAGPHGGRRTPRSALTIAAPTERPGTTVHRRG